MKQNTIIIIEEQAEMVAASCVPAEGDFIKKKEKPIFSISHLGEIESAGILYAKLLEELQDQAEVIIVDPRNPIYLFIKLTKEVFTHHVPFGKALQTIFLYRVPAVIVNGQILSSGQKTFHQDFIDKIKGRLK